MARNGMSWQAPCSATTPHGSPASTGCCCTPPAPKASGRPAARFPRPGARRRACPAGQEELDISVLEADCATRSTGTAGPSVAGARDRADPAGRRPGRPARLRRRCSLTAAPVRVLRLRPAPSGATRMLLAGHIKPGRQHPQPSASIPATAWPPAPPMMPPSTQECSPSTADSASISPVRSPTPSKTDPIARQYYGRPPLREALLLPEGPMPPPASISTGTVRKFSPPDPPTAAGAHRTGPTCR